MSYTITAENVYVSMFCEMSERELGAFPSEAEYRDLCGSWLNEVDWRKDQLAEIRVRLAQRREKLAERIRTGNINTKTGRFRAPFACMIYAMPIWMVVVFATVILMGAIAAISDDLYSAMIYVLDHCGLGLIIGELALCEIVAYWLGKQDERREAEDAKADANREIGYLSIAIEQIDEKLPIIL